ncbi:MAG: phosphate acyltransferase PlsX [Syntrophobacteraceae bacterium]|nr:phosphate acyltransferase PlsX [Syntrophobacteraceae bacterium]
MRIAVDAMGGDFAPRAVVDGALEADSRCGADLILFGQEERLGEIMAGRPGASRVQVVHAPDVIGMGEAAPVAIRRKRDASLVVAMRWLAEGSVDAVVSAGSTAATVSAARHYVGLVQGLRRPAMAVSLPTPEGSVLLADAGANAAADAVNLAQSAGLAHFFLKVTADEASPRVGLLNIGHEPIKGTRVTQRAFSLLTRSRLHFVGNVEPQGLFAGQIEAAVCDGFVGNVLLKVFEGLSETYLKLLESHLDPGGVGARTALREAFERFQKRYHHENVGGAPLLGVRRTVVVAHGRSTGSAIANAILLAANLVRSQVFSRMEEELERDGILSDLRHDNAFYMLEHLKSKWGLGQG